MKILKKGDPCPCCGQQIKTSNGDALMILSWIADKGRLPSAEEVREFYRMIHPEEQENNQDIPV